MLKRLGITILFMLTTELYAEVIGVEWIDKTKQFTEKEGDLIDIMIPGNGSDINRSYKDEEMLDEEPFPEKPIFQGSLGAPLQIYNWSQKLNLDPSTMLSKKIIDKTYSYRIRTNHFKSAISNKCHPYYLEKKLANTKDMNEYSKLIKKFFKKCDRKLVNAVRNKYSDLIKLSLKKYKIMRHKDVHPLKLKFTNNESLEGFLALKPNKKRPLIIVKCGIFCNGKSSTTNNMITSNLYDSGPFHVLMIANHTGSRNIKQNKRVNIGGFIEGQEVIKVAKWAKNNSYFKEYISEVHVLGISLGGHAALYSGLYNDELDTRIIKSVVGFCPVTNLRNSIKDATSKGIVGGVVSHIIQGLIEDNYDTIPYLKDHININSRKDMKRMFTNLAGINVDYINTLDNREFLPPFTNLRITSIDDYFYYNDYNQHNQNLETPTLIIASKNDPIVKYKRNSRLIKNKENINIIALKKGSHCAAEEAYGSYTVSKLLNNFFIKNSPSLKATPLIAESNFDFKQPKISFYEKYAGVRFLSFKDSDKIIAEYKIYKGEPYRKPFYAEDRMFRYEHIEININELPFKIVMPKSSIEAEILTRWLNANVHLKIDSSLFNISRQPANKIEWSTAL